MRYTCVTRCTYKDQLWEPGTIVEFTGDKIPKYFVLTSEVQKEKKAKESKAVSEKLINNDFVIIEKAEPAPIQIIPSN